MDNNSVNVKSTRGAKIALVIAIIFSVISTILICLYGTLLLDYVNFAISGGAAEGSDFAAGLGAAIALVLAIIFGIFAAVSSLFGLIPSIFAVRLDKNKIKFVGKILLILNSIYLGLFIITFAGVFVMTQL